MQGSNKLRISVNFITDENGRSVLWEMDYQRSLSLSFVLAILHCENQMISGRFENFLFR